MKNRTLHKVFAMLVIAVMVLNTGIFPMVAEASFYNASVNTQEDLRATVASASDGETISLGKSFELTTTDLIIEKNINLDLSGHTLTLGENSIIRVEMTGELTLMDSVGSGKLTGTSNGLITNEGQITITSGTVENTGSVANAIQSGGSVAMTGGTINATGPSGIGIEIRDSGSLTASGEAKISGDGGAISNNSSGTVIVEGHAMVMATNNQTGGYSTAISNWETGTVNINGGTVQNTVDGSVVRNSSTGTINVNGGHVISPGADGINQATAVINNTSTGAINVTGGKLTALGNGESYAIRNDATNTAIDQSNPGGTVTVTGGEIVSKGNNSTAITSVAGSLTIGGNATVRASGNGSTAISNSVGSAIVNGSAIIEATGSVLEEENGVSFDSRAIINEGMLTIGEHATVRVNEMSGVAVLNRFELIITGGVVGRVVPDSDGVSSPVTYVYGQATPPAKPTGVPVIIGDSGYRIKVMLPSASDIGNIILHEDLAGAALPDENDPLAFFQLEAQTSDGTPATLPKGTRLLLPFPTGTDGESNNYQIAHFASDAVRKPEILTASGKDGGILCESISHNLFMPVKFKRYHVTLDANGGTAPNPANIGVKLSGKLDFEKYGLTSLPSPSWSDYDFAGWFTEKSGGRKVTTEQTYSDDTTVYAQWTESHGDGGGSGNGGGSGDGNGSDDGGGSDDGKSDDDDESSDDGGSSDGGKIIIPNNKVRFPKLVEYTSHFLYNAPSSTRTLSLTTRQTPKQVVQTTPIYTDSNQVPITDSTIKTVDVPKTLPSVPNVLESTTPPDKNIEEDTFLDTPETKDIAVNDWIIFVIVAAILASLAVGIWFWKKKRQGSVK